MQTKGKKNNHGKRCVPYYHTNRDYESPIHEYRVAAGLTLNELARAINTSATSISALANGSASPIYEIGAKKGKLKIVAQDLCAFFNKEPSDLFPRYFCNILHTHTFDIVPFTSYSEVCAMDHAEIYEHKEYIAKFLQYLRQGLAPRHAQIVSAYFFDELNFTDMARKFKKTSNMF
jgi:transcriptional regulator with XRE-family HTH domain